MDVKLERLRERLLICSVCMDEYKDPRMLPCHHSLCFDCISNILQSSSVTGRYFRCPQCRTDICIPSGGIQQLPINFYIVGLQDELTNRDIEGNCELCKGTRVPSEFHCVDCDQDICRFCIHSHCLETHTEKPKVLRIQKTSVSANPISSNVQCSVHEHERLQLFCFTCKMPICVMCSCGHHKRHHLMPLSEKLHDFTSYLKKQMVQIDSDVKHLVDANQLIEDTKSELLVLTNKSILALDKAATGACVAIMEKKSALEKEILDSEREQMKDLGIIQTKVKTLLRSMHKGYHYLGDLQESDMCLEAFQSFKRFASELEIIRKEFVALQVNIQENRFISSDFSNIPEFSFGCLRNILYCGKLGIMQSNTRNLIIDPNTLETKREQYGHSAIIKKLASYSSLFKSILIFCFAFLFFLFIFWVLDEIKLSLTISSFIEEICDSDKIIMHKQIQSVKQFLQNLFTQMNQICQMVYEVIIANQ